METALEMAGRASNFQLRRQIINEPCKSRRTIMGLDSIIKALLGVKKRGNVATFLFGKKKRKYKKYERDYFKDQNYRNPNR